MYLCATSTPISKKFSEMEAEMEYYIFKDSETTRKIFYNEQSLVQNFVKDEKRDKNVSFARFKFTRIVIENK